VLASHKEQVMTREQRRDADYTAFWRSRDAYQVQRTVEGLMVTLFLLALLRGGWLHGFVRVTGLACILAAAWSGSKVLLQWIGTIGEHHDTGRTRRAQGPAPERQAHYR
jgi:hypothetical protein